MAEEKKEKLTAAQKLILSKIIAKRDNSTFVLCVNEDQEAQIEEYRRIAKQINGRQLTPEQNEEVTKMKQDVFNIHAENVYCPHCGKLAIVKGDIDNMQLSCECEGAKNELADKQAIEAQQAALDKEFYETQIAATNKAMNLYKEKYKDIVEFRRKAFENLDNDIMNAASL